MNGAHTKALCPGVLEGPARYQQIDRYKYVDIDEFIEENSPLKDFYKNLQYFKSESFLNRASDKETQEYYQYLFGNETVRQTSVSAKPLLGEQTSNSENLTGKPLVRTDELGRIKRGEAYIKAFQEFPAKTTLVPIFYHTLPEYKEFKEEFLVTKSSAKMYKPKHFDLSALSYDIGERYKIFNPQAKKSAVNTKKEDIESELKELLEPVNETKKQAILEAFKFKKYNLVISNLKELKRSNEINSADEIIEKIRNIKN